MPDYCSHYRRAIILLFYLDYETMKTVYIFNDIGGWYACDYADLLDIGGKCYKNKRDAIAGARNSGQWTHYIVSGTKKARKI